MLPASKVKKQYSNWDAIYQAGTPPWDAGKPHAELIRVLEEYHLRPRTVLEVGCGTGSDAIYLARRRFEVTAVDCSAIAIERARLRAERHDVVLRFVQADVFEFAGTAGCFDFVYDAGLYHAIREEHLEAYLDMLWRVTRPGSYYLCLAGAPGEGDDDGPPVVTADEMQEELCRLFEVIHLRAARLESSDPERTHPAWSCLMRRPVVQSK